jgi:hypothetical protein
MGKSNKRAGGKRQAPKPKNAVMKPNDTPGAENGAIKQEPTKEITEVTDTTKTNGEQVAAGTQDTEKEAPEEQESGTKSVIDEPPPPAAKKEAKEGHFEYGGIVYRVKLPKVNVPGIGPRTRAEICVDLDSQKYLVEKGIVSVIEEVTE